MGRPLNKKYFANRNIGSTSVTTDDGIGGQGIASVTIASTNNNYSTIPTATFAAPQLAGGVTAVAGTITMKVATVVINNAGAFYSVGDEVVIGGGGVVGDTLAGTYTQQTIITIDAVDAPETGVPTAISIKSGFAGIYSVLPSKVVGGSKTTNLSVDGGDGNNLRVDVTYGIYEIAVAEQGSGYTSAPTVTTSPVGNATKTAVLTTDTGPAGSTTNQENGIIANAFIPVADGGTQALAADIVKQVNDRAYRVKTSEGVGICKLVTDGAANAAGEMTIKATDGSGKTYYVAKITSRKAVLVPYGAAGHEFPLNSDGTAKSVKWSFGAASTANKVVQIENA